MRSVDEIRWDPSNWLTGLGELGEGEGVVLSSFLGWPFLRLDPVLGVEPSVVLLPPLDGLEFGFEVEGWGAKPKDVENK